MKKWLELKKKKMNQSATLTSYMPIEEDKEQKWNGNVSMFETQKLECQVERYNKFWIK